MRGTAGFAGGRGRSMAERDWFSSWSGGKDSALALWAAQSEGLKVTHLLNMQNSTGRQSRSHGLPPELLRRQAESLGLKLVTAQASWTGYEAAFQRALRKLSAAGVKGGVFGDIDIEAHRQWVERACGAAGMVARLPLWMADRRALMQRFVEAGFRAVVCTVRLDKLDASWLGREVDAAFIAALEGRPHVDLCGEQGEYHTFVYDGPVFQHPVSFDIMARPCRRGYGFLTYQIEENASEV